MNEEQATRSQPQSRGSLRLRVGVASTVGNVREHNEDNFFVPGRPSVRHDGEFETGGRSDASVHDPADSLFIVADGMGGQQAGEEASRMAIEIIPRAIQRRLAPEEQGTRSFAEAVRDSDTIQRAIRDAVAEANQEILGSSGAVSEYSNMGTTVVLTLFRNERVFIAGIGDSRAYRLRDGRIEQLTKDHSLADALVDAGTITKEEAPHHKYKNVLYLYLGCKDARGGPEEVRVLDLRAGDGFLLATDGLTGVVGEEELTRILVSSHDPQQSARALVELALANESKDNVTALVIHAVTEPAREPGGAH